ncbi:MAG: hypothetical protein CMM86_09485 [Rhodovulum sp.]|nr:hypothetical protein [Rhodovulum sp.]
MTDKLLEQIKADREAGTRGPWGAHNMVHADRGNQMTPEEIGEYVANSVRIGDPNRFLFVSGKHEDGGDCDVCHTGNGPKGPANTRRIARVPDMETRIISDAAEIARLTAELDATLEKLNSSAVPNYQHNDEVIDAARLLREALMDDSPFGNSEMGEDWFLREHPNIAALSEQLKEDEEE